MLQCGVSQWRDEYNIEGLCDGTQWSLKITGDFPEVNIWGSNDYPDEWDQFKGVLSKYSKMKIY